MKDVFALASVKAQKSFLKLNFNSFMVFKTKSHFSKHLDVFLVDFFVDLWIVDHQSFLLMNSWSKQTLEDFLEKTY